MSKEFTYSINGNLKEHKYIENFGELNIRESTSPVVNYTEKLNLSVKENIDLQQFLEYYENYNIDPAKNRLIKNVKNQFVTDYNIKLNNILTNTNYSDATKIVELEILKNELLEEEIEYRLYVDTAEPIIEFLNSTIETYWSTDLEYDAYLRREEIRKRSLLIKDIINYYNDYKNREETVTIDLNLERDKFVLQINKLIIDFISPINCEYSYGECDSKCKSHINITKQPLRGGKSCPPSSLNCNPGEDKCPHTPVDCQESYSKCKITNDSNAPSNIKGKCSKKNIIYKNSAHGGKPCKNETYVRCNCSSDCVGKFSYCASDCTKKYKITSNAKNGGKECDYNNDQIIDCNGDNCIESVDCIGSWSNCDSNCEKTWNITTEKQGRGTSCRFRNGIKLKCTEDDDSKCKEVINKNCKGRWTTCDSNCKKEWIIEDKASGSGTCDYSENTKYDCNEGEGNCLISKDCIGRWKTCDENCKSKWELLKKEQGKFGRCDLIDRLEKSCVHGEGLCIKSDINSEVKTNIDSEVKSNIKTISNNYLTYILTGLVVLVLLFIIIKGNSNISVDSNMSDVI